MLKIALSLLIALAAILPVIPGIAQRKTSVFTVPIVQRGQPVLISMQEFPPERWKQKTVGTFPWFIITRNGWYVDWDCERQPLRYFVVHHTVGEDMTAEEIAAIHFKRLYYNPEAPPNNLPTYSDPNYKTPFVYGLPAHSGHVVNGVETFIGYHHLIYPNGELKTTLVALRKQNGQWVVDMIGWHAGKWSVNCESIGVALVGNFASKAPTKEAMATLTLLFLHYRKFVPELQPRAHYDFVSTTCPGQWYPSWVSELLK